MERNLENSRATSHDKKSTAKKLRHIGSQKLSRRKSVFWISLKRKRMIYHCDVRRGMYDTNLNAKGKKFFFAKQLRYKSKFGLEAILDSQIK